VLVEPTPIERIKKTNIVVIRNSLQRQGGRKGIRRDPYVMDVNRGRNCYNCGEFGHLV